FGGATVRPRPCCFSHLSTHHVYRCAAGGSVLTATRCLRTGLPGMSRQEIAGRATDGGVRAARDYLHHGRGGFDASDAVLDKWGLRSPQRGEAGKENRRDRRCGLAKNADRAQAPAAGGDSSCNTLPPNRTTTLPTHVDFLARNGVRALVRAAR